MIKANAHKYSVSAMCKVLQVSRSTYYYEAKQKTDESGLTAAIIDIFKASRNNYGTRKIKQELSKKGYDCITPSYRSHYEERRDLYQRIQQPSIIRKRIPAMSQKQ